MCIMKLTKQHFQALADLCADTLEIIEPYTGYSEKNAIIFKFVDLCEESNPTFDIVRFRAWVNGKLEKKQELLNKHP